MGTKLVVVSEYLGLDMMDPREATPADIAAAHPKCGSCDYYGLNHPDGWNECINEDSPYFERHDGMIEKDVDYCRYHSELSK